MKKIHKEVAEVIKNTKVVYEAVEVFLNPKEKEKCNIYIEEYKKTLIHAFVDTFKKEDEKGDVFYRYCIKGRKNIFNPKEFKKRCGVEE